MILKIFNTGILQVNTYVLIDENSKEAVIIDLGGNFEDVYSYIKNNDATLKYILNTHGHADHIMGEVEAKANKPEVPIYLHKDDLKLAQEMGIHLRKWGVNLPFESVQIDKFVDENSDLKIGNEQIRVFHTPGHTRGGVSYLVGNNLFSGDTLFCRDIGRTDLEGGDYDTLISSIKEKLLPLKDDTIVYPGHGPSSTIGQERLYNTYLK